MITNPDLAEALDDITQMFPDASNIAIEEAHLGVNDMPHLGLHYLLNLITRSVDFSGNRALGATGIHTPATPLGRLAVNYNIDAIQQAAAFMFSGSTCEKSEGRFAQSIYRTLRPRMFPTTRKAIAYLADNQVVAFRKNYGIPTTLVLQETKLLPGIPAGTCIAPVGIRLSLGKERITANPSLHTADLGVPRGAKIRILRPLTFALEPEYVAALSYDPCVAIERAAGEPVYGSAALSMDLSVLQAQAAELVETAEI